MRCARCVCTFLPQQITQSVECCGQPVGGKEPPKDEQRCPMKGPFLEWEDRMIREHVQKFGPHRWPLLAKEMKSRNAKQCRERWSNHLDPKVSKAKWTDEEDNIIFEKFKEFGPKWALISHFLNGRTDNSVKNRWHASISKRTTRLADGSLTINKTEHSENALSSPEIEPVKEKPVKRIVFPSLAEAFPFITLDARFPLCSPVL